MTFVEQLPIGITGERAVVDWLRRRGWTILPAYQKLNDDKKGPRIIAPDCNLVSPDMLAFRGPRACWVEVKNKSAFTWHRVTSQWVTGIDLHHYEHYCRIASYSDWPIWLMFLQRPGRAKDSPPACPFGLFGGALPKLQRQEHHRHENWGSHGMVYWAAPPLIKIAELSELMGGAHGEEAA